MSLLVKVREAMTTYALKTAKNNAFHGARLTRRGRAISRIAVVLSVLILVASGYSALAAVSGGEGLGKSGNENRTREHLEVIVVAPGESLWSIAKLLGGNQEENVARIIELNALDKPALSAGARLIIPTRG